MAVDRRAVEEILGALDAAGADNDEGPGDGGEVLITPEPRLLVPPTITPPPPQPSAAIHSNVYPTISSSTSSASSSRPTPTMQSPPPQPQPQPHSEPQPQPSVHWERKRAGRPPTAAADGSSQPSSSSSAAFAARLTSDTGPTLPAGSDLYNIVMLIRTLAGKEGKRATGFGVFNPKITDLANAREVIGKDEYRRDIINADGNLVAPSNTTVKYTLGALLVDSVYIAAIIEAVDLVEQMTGTKWDIMGHFKIHSVAFAAVAFACVFHAKTAGGAHWPRDITYVVVQDRLNIAIDSYIQSM